MISHRAAILLYGLFLLGLSAILLGAGEIVVRSNGWRPWQVLDPGIRVEPGGRFMMSHPVLGYTHIPGAYKVTLWDGYSFRVTHDARTLRITHPVDPAGAESRPEIWIFGCSFTHGWSLSDEETYP